MFYRGSYYDALGRLVTGTRPGAGSLSRETIAQIETGEHRHLILQALCRGAVRRCEGESCAPCSAYIIASVRSGIPAALPEIFPGCQVKLWQPIKRSLRGKVDEAVKFITAWFETNPAEKLRFRDVQIALGITDASTFRNDVRNHADLKETLGEKWIVESGRGYIRLAFDNAAPE